MINIAGQYFLNHLLEREELIRQVNEAADCGIECLYAHARQGLRTPYMSEAWWDAMRTIAEVCRQRGIKMAIWDEDYYPSPVAGNRVIWNNPELMAQNLVFTHIEARAGEMVEQSLEQEGAVLRCFAVSDGGIEDITQHCGTVSPSWNRRYISHSAYTEAAKIGTPHWRAGMSPKRFALMWKADRDCRIVVAQVVRHTIGHNSDIMNPETTRRFIEYTHAEYIRQLGGELFKEVMASTFMDEPAPAGFFPWTGSFAAEFQSEHGYDLLPQLAHLALDIDEKSSLLRHHYRKTQMRLLCTAYLKQTQDWCREHGIESIGHLTRTEFLGWVALWWPNELRCYKYLDIPCSDPLGALVAWPDCSAYHTGLKVVVSAARLFDKPQAGSDALAVTGSETSLADIRFILDYHIAMGITYFNVHGLSYSLDGPRKDEVPPPLFYQHSQWPQIHQLWSEAKQICEFMAGGETTVQLGVLYSAPSFYCRFTGEYRTDPREEAMHRFSEYLLSHHKDFDFLDELTMAEWGAEKLLEEFPYFIVAHCSWMEAGTAALLDEYVELGGKLWVYGEQPALLEGGTWPCTVVDELSFDAIPGPAVTGEGTQDILFRQVKVDGAVYSFAFNRASRAFTGTLDGAELWLAPRSSRLLAPGEAVREPDFAKAVALRDGWSVQFDENHVPLNVWTTGGAAMFDLLHRQCCSEANPEFIQSRFLYSGSGRVTFVMDVSALEGDGWELTVNGCPVTDFKKSRRYDCLNLEADITPMLRSGSVPTLNIVKLRGAMFTEMPYLYGNFQAIYRHGQKALPYLTACGGKFNLDVLQPWSVLGYGTYSGRAVYRRVFEAAEARTYHLDMGRVIDGVNVRLNGELLKVCIGEPFMAELGCLQPGKYELELEVFNALGNHDRLADLPSGLLGPVRIG